MICPATESHNSVRQNFSCANALKPLRSFYLVGFSGFWQEMSGGVQGRGCSSSSSRAHLRCRRWAVAAAPRGTRCGAGRPGAGTAWSCRWGRSWQPGMGTPGSSRGCCRLKCWGWTPEPSPTWRSSGQAGRAAGEKMRDNETRLLAFTVLAHQKNSQLRQFVGFYWS